MDIIIIERGIEKYCGVLIHKCMLILNLKLLFLNLSFFFTSIYSNKIGGLLVQNSIKSGRPLTLIKYGNKNLKSFNL